MDVILPGTSFVFQVLGNTKYTTKTKFIKSIFNLEININENLLIYNTLSKSLVLLNEQEKEMYINNIKNKKICEFLVDKCMLVEEGKNEILLCEQIRVLAKQFNYETSCICNYTILTTTDCNARCFYCYEKELKKINMNDSIAYAVSNFISKHCAERNIKLNWFGGEPLFNASAIDTICKNLKENSIDYTSSMVSNAYLFNDELIYKAKKLWNLKKVQITLDGTETIYNKTKSYIYSDCKNPFLKVIENIEKLMKNDIRIAIRLNVTDNNIADLNNLIDFLSMRLKDYNNFYVYTGVVIDYSNIATIWNCNKRNKIIEERNKLEEKIYNLGLKHKNGLLDGVKVNQCLADDDSSIVISPSGEICKCEHLTEGPFIGDVLSDKIDYAKAESWKVRHPKSELCETCVYYPLCIRLEKCPAFRNFKCNQYEQSQYIMNLKLSVLNVYRNWCNERNI